MRLQEAWLLISHKLQLAPVEGPNHNLQEPVHENHGGVESLLEEVELQTNSHKQVWVIQNIKVSPKIYNNPILPMVKGELTSKGEASNS